MLIAKKRWTNHPQFPLQLNAQAQKDIVGLVVPGTFAKDYRTGLVLLPSNAAAYSAGTQGRAIATTATATDKWEASGPATNPVSTTDFTIEVLVNITSSTSLACIACFNSAQTPITTDSTGRRRGLLAFGSTTPFDIYFWGESADLDSGVKWRNDGSIQHVFVTATGGTMRFYRDGFQIASGTTPTLAAALTTQFITIGSRHPSGATAPAMKVFKASIRNRALNGNEILALTQDPWRDFKPLQKKFYINSVSGGGSTIFGSYYYRQVAGMAGTP